MIFILTLILCKLADSKKSFEQTRFEKILRHILIRTMIEQILEQIFI